MSTPVSTVYNPAKYCSAHLELTQRGRRGVTHALLAVACENCGAGFETLNPRRRYCGDRCRMAAFARRRRSAQRREAPAVTGVRPARWEASDDSA